MSVQRDWDEPIMLMISILILIGLIWSYHQQKMAVAIYYWMVAFGCLFNVLQIIFLFIFPHCKIENECLYLYMNMFKIKKIYLPNIENIYEINDSRNGKGFKFILKANKEVDYFPQNQTKNLLCKVRLFFESHCGEVIVK
jgi:hypothetical protein